jgi:hypothetical protein
MFSCVSQLVLNEGVGSDAEICTVSESMGRYNAVALRAKARPGFISMTRASQKAGYVLQQGKSLLPKCACVDETLYTSATVLKCLYCKGVE